MIGLFVLIAGALLVGTVLAISGISGRRVKTYHYAFFTFCRRGRTGNRGALFGRASGRPRGKYSDRSTGSGAD